MRLIYWLLGKALRRFAWMLDSIAWKVTRASHHCLSKANWAPLDD